MTTQFEFHLVGARAPEGELEVDDLLAIVGSLKEVASKIGRIETDAEPVGRAPRRTQQISRLTIGLAPGSTTVRVHRTGVIDALDFDSPEERAFDEKFADVVESFARNERPDWVSDSLGIATADLIAALQQTATSARFSVDGRMRARFRTAEIRRDIWRTPPRPGEEEIVFTGRLYSANLNLHRLLIEDAVGNHVALPAVADDIEASRLLDSIVVVVGVPVFDTAGKMTEIRDASISAAPTPLGATSSNGAISLDDILDSAPGPELDEGIELSDDEFYRFLRAVRE